jgi:hypothetical protein
VCITNSVMCQHNYNLGFDKNRSRRSEPSVKLSRNRPVPGYIVVEHILTLWSRVPLERLKVVQPLGSFPVFYGTRRFITAFTRDLHLYLS